MDLFFVNLQTYTSAFQNLTNTNQIFSPQIYIGPNHLLWPQSMQDILKIFCRLVMWLTPDCWLDEPVDRLRLVWRFSFNPLASSSSMVFKKSSAGFSENKHNDIYLLMSLRCFTPYSRKFYFCDVGKHFVGRKPGSTQRETLDHTHMLLQTFPNMAGEGSWAGLELAPAPLVSLFDH